MMPDSQRSLCLLVFTTLYPNAEQPHHGIFVENRLRHLLAASDYRARVVAPVPWFPFKSRRFGRYAAYARIPRREVREGIVVEHPRYLVIPKVGMRLAPFLLHLGARRTVRRLLRTEPKIDVIDAHYFYPDGVAAARLAREPGIPLTITGRGTDLNLIPSYPFARRRIRDAAERADGLVTVCAALADDLAALGVPRERIRVLRNGVDPDVFHEDVAGGAAMRRDLGVQGPVLASVGHLIPRKGHDLAIRSLARRDEGDLVIAGTGPEESALRALAADLGVADRVHFLGAVPHAALKRVYSAADVLVLASQREGWPNVLLESLACGTPVVATAVNGSPEVVQDPVAGRIVTERTPEALAAAVDDLRAQPPERAAVRSYAEAFSWDATTRGQMDMFAAVTGATGETGFRT